MFYAKRLQLAASMLKKSQQNNNEIALKKSLSLTVYNRGKSVYFLHNLNSSKSIFLVLDFSKASGTRLPCRP